MGRLGALLGAWAVLEPALGSFWEGLGALLGLFLEARWAALGRLGALGQTFGRLEPFGAPCSRPLGPGWGHPGGPWSRLVQFWSRNEENSKIFETTKKNMQDFSPVGPSSGSSWAVFGASWLIFGPSCAVLTLAGAPLSFPWPAEAVQGRAGSLLVAVQGRAGSADDRAGTRRELRELGRGPRPLECPFRTR